MEKAKYKYMWTIWVKMYIYEFYNPTSVVVEAKLVDQQRKLEKESRNWKNCMESEMEVLVAMVLINTLKRSLILLAISYTSLRENIKRYVIKPLTLQQL